MTFDIQLAEAKPKQGFDSVVWRTVKTDTDIEDALVSFGNFIRNNTDCRYRLVKVFVDARY